MRCLCGVRTAVGACLLAEQQAREGMLLHHSEPAGTAAQAMRSAPEGRPYCISVMRALQDKRRRSLAAQAVLQPLEQLASKAAAGDAAREDESMGESEEEEEEAAQGKQVLGVAVRLQAAPSPVGSWLTKAY